MIKKLDFRGEEKLFDKNEYYQTVSRIEHYFTKAP